MKLKTKGAALVMGLLMILLLSGLVVTYLSHALVQRQISNQSAAKTEADLIAQSALSRIVGDLKREIVRGSDPGGEFSVYIPLTAEAILPERNTAGNLIPNLVRRSLRNDPISISSLASPVNSTGDLSANGKMISLARWNSHYLIPKASPVNDASDPIPDFMPPDWVILTRSGIEVMSDADLPGIRDHSSRSYVIGRYAYAIYDEGGLLDLNVAGYDPAFGLPSELTGAKGSLAFAELPCLPGLGTTDSLNDIFGWRNYATLRAHGDFDQHNFTFEAGSQYGDWVFHQPTGFLQASATVWNHHTDQMFVSRQALIQMRRALAFSVSSLPFLGTFSRDTNLPTLRRVLPYRVSQSFLRKNGTPARRGDPLFQRFSLERLMELTQGNVEAIQRDFGLIAMGGSNQYWGYCGRSGSTLKSSIDSSWLNGDREPDFFELIGFALSEEHPGLVLTVGANLIDEFDSDTNVTVIACLDPSGSSTLMIRGTDSVSCLNRPFQSVGELRYVPNTNDDMLDLFCARNLDETLPMHAGVLNRNTRNAMVLAAVLSGAYKNPGDLKSGISDSAAIAAAKTLVSDVKIAQSRGEGLDRITPTQGDAVALRRALADVCTTRVWNLMIDVIAQSGRYPPGALHLDQFVVEGESRYWLHIALDRFTGKILDVQCEPVHE